MTDNVITPALLLSAYSSGLFPMSEGRDDPDIFWVDPQRRGVFPLDRFHVSRSLAKRLRRGDYSVTYNRDFQSVMEHCADRPETWINAEIFDLYGQLHRHGHAHSLEVWMDGVLAGGTYGVTLGAAFFGESMFSTRRDGSKIALAWLVAHLRNTGFMLFDTQFITPHLASLGAIEIPRGKYRTYLSQAIEKQASFTASALPETADQVLQCITQTS